MKSRNESAHAIKVFARALGISERAARNHRARESTQWLEFLADQGEAVPSAPGKETAAAPLDDLAEAQKVERSSYAWYTYIVAHSQDMDLKSTTEARKKAHEVWLAAKRHLLDTKKARGLYVDAAAVRTAAQEIIAPLGSATRKMGDRLAAQMPEAYRDEFRTLWAREYAQFYAALGRLNKKLYDIAPMGDLAAPFCVRTCESPVAWVENNLSLPPVVSPAHPGPVSLHAQPWMAEVLQSFLERGLTDLYLTMCTQVGKTTVCLFGMALLIEFDPAPLIWALPSDELARRHALGRLLPFLEGNEAMAKYLPDNDRDKTVDMVVMKPMTIYCTGIGSPGKLASVPAAYVICDEEGKFENRHKEEAHPVHLLKERQKTLPRKLMVHASTPNTETHVFWGGFLETDQRKFFVPCPHCGQEMTFDFNKKTVIWDTPEDGDVTVDIVRRTARLRCPTCGGDIPDSERIEMMARGRWKATNLSSGRNVRGYHLNALYSAFLTVGDVASEFWLAQKAAKQGRGFAGLQNFYNSYLGQPWIPYVARVSDEAVRACCEDYELGSWPAGMGAPICLVYAADPGQDATHWSVWAFFPGDEPVQALVDYGTVLAIDDIPAHAMSLNYNGERIKIVVVDSGDWTQKVYDVCEANLDKILMIPSKGTGARAAGTYAYVTLHRNPRLKLLTYVDYQAKVDFYIGSISQKNGMKLMLPANVGEDFCRQLSGQTLETKSNGQSQFKPLPNDHWGDTGKLARVLWWDIAPQATAAAEEAKNS